MKHLELWVFSLDGSANPLECYPTGFGCLQSNRHFPSQKETGLRHMVKPVGWNRMEWDEMR